MDRKDSSLSGVPEVSGVAGLGGTAGEIGRSFKSVYVNIETMIHVVVICNLNREIACHTRSNSSFVHAWTDPTKLL